MRIGGVNIQADDATWRRAEEFRPARVLQGEKSKITTLQKSSPSYLLRTRSLEAPPGPDF